MEATWRREVLKGERVARITNVGRVSHIALASVSPSGRHAAALEVPVTLSGPAHCISSSWQCARNGARGHTEGTRAPKTVRNSEKCRDVNRQATNEISKNSQVRERACQFTSNRRPLHGALT